LILGFFFCDGSFFGLAMLYLFLLGLILPYKSTKYK
jgi:hypothetical protein